MEKDEARKWFESGWNAKGNSFTSVPYHVFIEKWNVQKNKKKRIFIKEHGDWIKTEIEIYKNNKKDFEFDFNNKLGNLLLICIDDDKYIQIPLSNEDINYLKNK